MKVHFLDDDIYVDWSLTKAYMNALVGSDDAEIFYRLYYLPANKLVKTYADFQDYWTDFDEEEGLNDVFTLSYDKMTMFAEGHIYQHTLNTGETANFHIRINDYLKSIRDEYGTKQTIVKVRWGIRSVSSATGAIAWEDMREDYITTQVFLSYRYPMARTNLDIKGLEYVQIHSHFVGDLSNQLVPMIEGYKLYEETAQLLPHWSYNCGQLFRSRAFANSTVMPYSYEGYGLEVAYTDDNGIISSASIDNKKWLYPAYRNIGEDNFMHKDDMRQVANDIYILRDDPRTNKAIDNRTYSLINKFASADAISKLSSALTQKTSRWEAPELYPQNLADAFQQKSSSSFTPTTHDGSYCPGWVVMINFDNHPFSSTQRMPQAREAQSWANSKKTEFLQSFQSSLQTFYNAMLKIGGESLIHAEQLINYFGFRINENNNVVQISGSTAYYTFFENVVVTNCNQSPYMLYTPSLLLQPVVVTEFYRLCIAGNTWLNGRKLQNEIMTANEMRDLGLFNSTLNKKSVYTHKLKNGLYNVQGDVKIELLYAELPSGTDDGAMPIKRLPIAVIDLCPSDFYIEWNDRMGGVQSQRFTRYSTRNDNYNRNTMLDANDKTVVWSTEMSTRWTMRSEWVRKEDLPIFESMLVSDDIHLFVTATGQYHKVIPRSSSFDEQWNKRGLIRFEVELELDNKQFILY